MTNSHSLSISVFLTYPGIELSVFCFAVAGNEVSDQTSYITVIRVRHKVRCFQSDDQGIVGILLEGKSAWKIFILSNDEYSLPPVPL